MGALCARSPTHHHAGTGSFAALPQYHQSGPGLWGTGSPGANIPNGTGSIHGTASWTQSVVSVSTPPQHLVQGEGAGKEGEGGETYARVEGGGQEGVRAPSTMPRAGKGTRSLKESHRMRQEPRTESTKEPPPLPPPPPLPRRPHLTGQTMGREGGKERKTWCLWKACERVCG